MKKTPIASNPAKKKNRTWEHPEGSGIKIAEITNKTDGRVFSVSYQVRIPAKLLGVPGKREIFQRPTEVEAERAAEDRFTALKKHGTEFAKITPSAQRQAAMAWGILAKHNTDAGVILDLIEVVEAGIRSLSPAGGKKMLSEVFAELRAMKQQRSDRGRLDSSTIHDSLAFAAALEAENSIRNGKDAGEALLAAIEARTPSPTTKEPVVIRVIRP